jgi:hypothetical protein
MVTITGGVRVITGTSVSSVRVAQSVGGSGTGA